MSETHRERMSRVDTAWLRMDNDVNLMMITGVWILEPRLGYAALCERVAAKLLQYGRFRQRVVRDGGGASWVDDEDFDIRRHVVRERLAKAGGESERERLQARVAELAAEPLDAERPLWRFHLVERYGAGSALVARVHHCIGDGIALIAVMMSITDGGADPPRRRRGAGAAAAIGGEGAERAGDGEGSDRAADSAKARFDPLGELPAKALAALEATLARSLDVLADPRQGLAGVLDSARQGARIAVDLGALALMDDDSPTLLKGSLSGSKRVAWGEPIALDHVKAIGKALGCSVNDVLLGAVSGAIAGWLREQGDEPAGKEIRAMVPVNLRPLADAWKLGNRFGLAPLVLPIGAAGPLERVYAVRARMNELKTSTQPMLAFAVLAVAGLAPKPVQDAILGMFASKATAVMTNVPGPPARLSLCGSSLVQTMFWVPASGAIGVGVSILSYAGGVQFGLITDAAVCADPQAIVDRFAPEFEQLLLLTMMLPWDGAAA